MQIAQNSIIFSTGKINLSLGGDKCKIGEEIQMVGDQPIWEFGNRCVSGA